MKSKTIYVAVDGDEFDTIEECEKHEKYITSLPDSVRLYDASMTEIKPEIVFDNTKSGKMINLFRTQENVEKAYDSASVIVFRDTETLQEDVSYIQGYWGFFEDIEDVIPGFYEYNYCSNTWERVDIGCLEKKIKEEIARCDAMKKLLEECSDDR